MLDESAIEAMIARQREAMDNHETAPSVRTVQTDEFEVYERQAGPKDPEPVPATRTAPVQVEEEFEVFERAPAPPPAPAPEAPAAALAPAPAPTPVAEPEPTPSPAAPTPIPAPAQPFAPQPTRRPEVWPPLSSRTAPATTERPAITPRTHAPTAPANDTAAPEPHRAPAATHHAFPDLSSAAPAPADGDAPRIAIVQALFNEEITGDMANLARQKADRLGAPVVLHLKVPGVYDLPLAVQTLLRRDDIDCVVALGCVVTGETRHDEVITHATAKSLQEVSLATGKPVGFGVIGPGMTWKQAEARVVNGKHAVEAAVAQWRILRSLTT